MRNTNCLAGMRCPRCRQDGEFLITATTEMSVTDDGTATTGGNVDWTTTSAARCPACDFVGIVRDFRVRDRDQMLADLLTWRRNILRNHDAGSPLVRALNAPIWLDLEVRAPAAPTARPVDMAGALERARCLANWNDAAVASVLQDLWGDPDGVSKVNDYVDDQLEPDEN